MAHRAQMYGEGYEAFESRGESQTTNSAYQTKVSGTTLTLEPGTYLVRASARLGASSKSSGANAKLDVSGAATDSVSHVWHNGTNDTDDKVLIGERLKVVIATAGTLAVKLQYKSVDGVVVAAIEEAVLEVHRVSK